MQQLSLWSAAPAGGLVVHRASRTEHLAQRLALELERNAPASVLEPRRVIVSHDGLRRWLMGQFAQVRVRDTHGIAANIEMILPWQWLERRARALLGEANLIGGEYRRDRLRWHVYAALAHERDADIAGYLAGDEPERRRYELAERTAAVFEQYLIYRPDWIAQWERQKRGGDWQARVWRRVRAAIGAPHRAERREPLCTALARDETDTMPLHVFGVNHLSPDVLAALRASAARRFVHLYFPDPCREHWVYFRTHRAQIRAGGDAQALYYEVGHPLLAALGRMAQDFCMALDDADAAVERDPDDDAEPAAEPKDLLGAVQSSVRCAQPELVAHFWRARGAALGAHDTSLRVHVCHTRLRELEVLRDALLGLLADHPTLSPSDIVVMAPDIARYAPIVGAVFGAPARYEADPAHIPWHLADVTLARTHTLAGAWLRVLDLADGRFAVSDVMDLLDIGAVARRFGIDEPAREALEHAVRRARVAWGLDAAMKREVSGVELAANSWQFGLDRLYAGFVLGEDAADGPLALPAGGVGGSVSEAVGRLDQLLESLRDLRAGLRQPRSLAQWSAWLARQADALLRAEPGDDAEQAALAALQRTLAALETEGAAAGDDALPWSVMRRVLGGALESVLERQPFLLGGVTFCGLVPQRAIPFRVVCVLGLNEGEFPRQAPDAGVNRMLREPRPGDRDVRNEDRYLFLEALMAARGHVHLSYIGEDVNAGTVRNPAAPLAELLHWLDDATQSGERPWRVAHPLQPFDARYFSGAAGSDPRLFSFATALAQVPDKPALEAPAFLGAGPAAGESAGADGVALAALRRFWRNPLRSALRDRAGVSLEALQDDSWPDREPFEPRLGRRELIESRLMYDALRHGGDVPAAPPRWLAESGLLAAGAAGQRAYEEARICAQSALEAARSVLGAAPRLRACRVECELDGGLRLSGTIDRVYHVDERAPCLFEARPWTSADFRSLLPFYLDYAALRLGALPAAEAHFVEKATKSSTSGTPPLLAAIRAQDETQLRAGLTRLAALALGPEPLVFPPATAWAWLNAAPAERAAAARRAWEGEHLPGNRGTRGERHHSPPYAELMLRDAGLLVNGCAAHARFVAATEAVADLLDPSRTLFLRMAADA